MIEPHDEPCGTARELRDVPFPARRTAGIRTVAIEPGRAVYAMDVPPWALDATGVVLPGAVGVLLDAALGMGAVTATPGRSMITSHLHIEFAQSIPAGTGTLLAEGHPLATAEGFGHAAGVVTTDDGTVVAHATLGAIYVDPVARERGRLPEAATTTSIADCLGTRVTATGPDGVTTVAVADGRFANAFGGVHGGFGIVIGERVLDVALRAALGERGVMRLVELRAAYLRPIAADGTDIECHGSVVHLGRRLAAARGEVRDQQGRVALLVDASYIAI